MFIYLFLGKNRYCDNLVILIPIIPVKEKVIKDIGKKMLEFKKYKPSKDYAVTFSPFYFKTALIIMTSNFLQLCLFD